MSNTGWSLLISALALFYPLAIAAQDNPIDSFRNRIENFAKKLQARYVDLKVVNISQIDTISDPERQALVILNSARLLVNHQERFEAKTLDQLGVSGQYMQSMAYELVHSGIIRRGDYVAQVGWALRGQAFHTLAVVHPKGQDKEERPDFEPLLYFTPVRIENTSNSNEAFLPTASSPAETFASLRLPEDYGFLAPTIEPVFDSAPGPQTEGSWRLERSNTLTIWNDYGVCVIVTWTVAFNTDGCRILNPGDHVYPSRVPSKSLSCLFWDVRNKAVENRYWSPQNKCFPRAGTNKREEECLNARLDYTPGLRLLDLFVPLADSAPTKPQDLCCSEPRHR
jgi:hypothetical protein